MRFCVPHKVIEDSLPELAVRGSREQAYGERRETPYLWRARRPGVTFRAMIAASLAETLQEFWKILQGRGNKSLVVLDPLAGNGTAAREAEKLGLTGIACDIDPVACLNMAVSHQSVPFDVIQEIKGLIPQEVYDLYSTQCDLCGRESTTIARVWGSVLGCPDGHSFVTAPDMWASHPIRDASPYGHLPVSRTEKCPLCGKRASFSLKKKDAFVPLMIVYECPIHKEAAKVPSSSDLEKMRTAEHPLSRDPLSIPLPREWRELRTRGFSVARDLFSPEAALFFVHAMKISRLPQFARWRHVLLMSLADAMRSSCRMSSISHGTFLPFDGHAIFHPHFTELSPVCGKGRTWFSLLRRPGGVQIKVLRTNSEFIPLASESVDAVITDPPYFDYILYSSSAYLAYISLSLAFPPDTKEIGKENFADSMSSVFRECFRVLKPGGVVAFTFRHSNAQAWIELGKAIAKGGGIICAVHSAQNDMDAQLGRRIASRDAIIVCAKRGERETFLVSLEEILEGLHAEDAHGALPASIIANAVNANIEIDRKALQEIMNSRLQSPRPHQAFLW